MLSVSQTPSPPRPRTAQVSVARRRAARLAPLLPCGAVVQRDWRLDVRVELFDLLCGRVRVRVQVKLVLGLGCERHPCGAGTHLVWRLRGRVAGLLRGHGSHAGRRGRLARVRGRRSAARLATWHGASAPEHAWRRGAAVGASRDTHARPPAGSARLVGAP